MSLALSACDNGALTAPLEWEQFATQEYNVADCQLREGECDRLEALLNGLLEVYTYTHECHQIIRSAQDRFYSSQPGVGFRDGGESTTVFGYILPSLPSTTNITTLGYTELGVTVIHEEAHHLGISMQDDHLAEAVGLACGQFAE